MTVSALRTLTIGSPSSIYGVCPVSPPLRWPMAGPDEVLDYSMDVSALLLDVGDTISAATLAVSPSGTGELVSAGLDVEGGVITAWLGPGVSGRNYTIRIEAQTHGGLTFEWFIGLLIDPSQATYPLILAPNPTFGAPLTWVSNFASGFNFSEPANSGLLVLL